MPHKLNNLRARAVRKVTSPFARAVLGISGATMLAQLLVVLAAPLLTRLYTPDQFGAFTIVNAASLVFAAGMALRLELAIPIPAKGAEARQLVHVATQSIVVLSVLSLTATALFTEEAAALLRLDAQPEVVMAIPVMAAAYSLFNVFNSVAVRDRRFRAIARRQIVVGVAMVTLQVAAGVMSTGVVGLVVATAAAQIIGAVTLAVGSGVSRKHDVGISGSSRRTLAHYWRFPVLLAPAGWINTASNHGQVVVLGLFFSTAAAGWFGLVVRVVSLPMSLLGQAVAQVYLSELASGRRNGTGTEWTLFIRTTRMLLVAGSALGIALALVGPWAFSVVFGRDWEVSGDMARAFALAAASQFVSSPLSQTLVVLGRALSQLLLDVLRLLVVVGTLGAAHQVRASPTEAIWFLSIGLTAVNLLNWELCRRTLRNATLGGGSDSSAS